MTTAQTLITLGLIAASTALTRFLPFWVFPEGRQPPAWVARLGRVLPAAVIGMLVVYCLKDAPASAWHGLPELVAIGFIVLLHRWKKNTLLSIGGGTALYMLLVQTVLR